MSLLILSYLLVGLLAGLSAGMFGVGGGIIIVPALLIISNLHGVDSTIATHSATATSLACMFFITASSAFSHSRKNNIRFAIFKRYFLSLIIGSIVGILLASHLSGNFIKIIFSLFLFIMAWQLWNAQEILEELPMQTTTKALNAVFFFISLVAAILGIGGGVLMTPYLNRQGLPLVKAAGLSSLATLVIAFVGTITWMTTDHWGIIPTHHFWSFISWQAVLFIGLAALISVPLGVKLVMQLKTRLLKRIFALLLIALALQIVL